MVERLVKVPNLEVIVTPELDSAEIFKPDMRTKAKALDVARLNYSTSSSVKSAYEVKPATESDKSATVNYSINTGCECDYCDCDGCEG